MAATATPVSASVVLVSTVGKTAAGKDITKKTTLSKISIAAADQDIYDLATAIGNILNFPVSQVEKLSTNVLTNA
jgi:hypothetical protein